MVGDKIIKKMDFHALWYTLLDIYGFFVITGEIEDPDWKGGWLK